MKGLKKISRPASKLGVLFLLSTALVLLTLTGCSIKNTRNADPYPQELTPTTPKIESPDSLTAMLRFSSKQTGLKGRAALTIKSPDLIRVEIYGVMGKILTVVAGDSNECKVYKKGIIRKCNWNEPELSGLLTPRNLVPILLGKGELAFRDSKERQSSSDGYGRLTRIVASLNTTTASREATKASRGATSKDYQSAEQREPVKITIGDYRIIEGLRVPFSFVLDGRGDLLTINYYTLRPNPEIRPSTFSLGTTNN